MNNIEIKILQSNWNKSNKFYTGQEKNNDKDCGFHILVNITLMIKYFDIIVSSPHWDKGSNKVDQLNFSDNIINNLINNSAQNLRLELEELLILLSTRWIKEERN